MRVEVSGRQFTFPPICACCGAPANTVFTASASKKTGKKVVHTSTHAWDFPYCSVCTAHYQAAQNAGKTVGALGVGVLVFALFAWLAVSFWLGVFIFVVGFAGIVALQSNLMTQAKAMCRPQCACVGQCVSLLDWDGARQVFEITSLAYALAFMVANERKLVNLSPQARQFLVANGYGQQIGNQQSARRYET